MFSFLPFYFVIEILQEEDFYKIFFFVVEMHAIRTTKYILCINVAKEENHVVFVYLKIKTESGVHLREQIRMSVQKSTSFLCPIDNENTRARWVKTAG